MSLDTQVYFLIILGGFASVWGYRKVRGLKKPVGEFEYLGFSAFWGMALLAFFSWELKDKPESIQLLEQNPYAAGFLFAIFGAAIGAAVGFLVNSIFYAFDGKK